MRMMVTYSLARVIIEQSLFFFPSPSFHGKTRTYQSKFPNTDLLQSAHDPVTLSFY